MKIKKIFLLAFVISLASCSSTKKTVDSSESKQTSNKIFSLTEITTDETYGFTEKNPINVGGVEISEGPKNQRRYLDALAGPNGESISYQRLGSCCPFKTKNGFMGGGMLDKYELKWEGQQKPVVLYINFYDYGTLKVPVGLTLKK